MPIFHDFMQPHDKYYDFVVTKVIALEELNCTLRELTHVPTGAAVIHIENDDPENLFCLSFKTYPSNSNGVAHVLEHTVLCGSRKFPIKDPFFSMSRRSLNTFMNALTGADFTCYPAASQVEQDFYNLLEVYLDAVFHPELKELSFLQEGHRLAFKDPSDPHSPLEFKGIVYNEMKGSLSSRDARMIHVLLSNILPDLPYAHNSGGTPQEIPLLTYAQLSAFHETYYHPSRCLFFFYGNLPLSKHLDFIAEHALKGVEKASPLPPLKRQPRFTGPKTIHDYYPIEASEDVTRQTMVAFGWLTVPLEEQKELLALSVIDSIFMDTDASLLKHALLKSKLCVQASAYMDTEISEVPYFVFCKGCKKEDVDTLQQHLVLALKEICLNGIPYHLIEAAIHQLEFSRLEIVGDHAPYGLTLFMRSGLAKQHQCPPENALLIHSLFEELLINVKDPEYLPALIKKHFIDNPHFVRVVMEPDPQMGAREADQEKALLEKIRANLTPKEKQNIIIQTEQLEEFQKETEAQSLDCLPKITINDVPRAARDFPLTRERINNLDVFHHDCFTNHIIYADLVFNLPHIEQHELPYLQLLLAMMPELGINDLDYAASLEYTHAHTGGIGASTALYAQIGNPEQMRPCITVRGKALVRKADKLFELLKGYTSGLRLDETGRIEHLMRQINESMQSRINRNALRYAIQLAQSGLSPASHISETWSGIHYYKTIRALAGQLETKLDHIIQVFTSLRDRLFSTLNPHLVLSCDQPTYQHLHQKEFFGLTHLVTRETPLWQPQMPLSPTPSQARLITSPVAFTCEAFKTVDYLHPHSPALSVSTFLMDNKILHPRIREKGGAYGVGAHYSPMLGLFYFHSYSDPHIARSVHTFHEATKQLATVKVHPNDLSEAILGLIQQFDTPISPGSRAIAAYSSWREGKTLEMRQAYREKVLALTPTDIQTAVSQQLLKAHENSTLVTLADQALLDKENALFAQGSGALPIFPISH